MTHQTIDHMDKKGEVVALIGLAIQLVLSGIFFLFSVWSKSQSVTFLATFSIFGCAVWLSTFLHLRQQRLVSEENEDELLEATSDSSLFENDDQPLLSSSHKLRQMEKFVLPTITIALGAGLIITGIFLFRSINQFGQPLSKALLNQTIIGLIICAFVSFIIGRFGAGMSASTRYTHVLKGGSGYLLSCSLLSLLIAVSIILYHFSYTWAHTTMTYCLPFIIMLVGIDFIAHIVLDFYRPRVHGQIERPPYQSFFLGLLAEPQGILHAAAHSLDYQFGFKISETWFYKFVEKILAPLVLFQIFVLYLLSTIVVIDPQETGIIERFGVPMQEQGVLQPGIHFKLPWPVEKIRVVSTSRIQTLEINPHDSGESTILWSEAHHKDRTLMFLPTSDEIESRLDDDKMLTGIPVGALLASGEIQYRICDPYDYTYNQKNPEKFIYNISLRELVRYAVTTEFFEFMGQNLIAINQLMKERIQKELDRHNVGVEIVLVAIYGVHPPVEVSEAFESVVASKEEKQAKILSAEAYTNKLLPQAQAEEQAIMLDAQSYAERQKLLSQAESEQFAKQQRAFELAPATYQWRHYLKTIETVLKDVRKIIISSRLKNNETDIIDLKYKNQPNLLDMDIGR